VAEKFYRILEHTADIRIRVEAKDLETLFTQTARAMFDIIAEKKAASGGKKVELAVSQKARDLEELLVNWLNELLSVSAVKGWVFSNFKIKSLKENSLEALAWGQRVSGYKINKEIKAATYHGLQIVKTGDGWKAEVIFDA
jgi:SHS2 domain-containing protein